MSARQKAWGQRVRPAIIEKLGGKCKECGSVRNLELDVIHKTPRDPDSNHHRKWDVSRRVSFWRAELLHDNLQLLCAPCNGRKGEPELKL